jgi:hypothetical protein
LQRLNPLVGSKINCPRPSSFKEEAESTCQIFTVLDLKKMCAEANYDIESNTFKNKVDTKEKYKLIDSIYNSTMKDSLESTKVAKIFGWSIFQNMTISLNRDDRYTLLREKLKSNEGCEQIDMINHLHQVNSRERALNAASPDTFRDEVTRIVLRYF